MDKNTILSEKLNYSVYNCSIIIRSDKKSVSYQILYTSIPNYTTNNSDKTKTKEDL